MLKGFQYRRQVVVALILLPTYKYHYQQSHSESPAIHRNCLITEAIGNTPLVYFPSLSASLGCQIYGKAEFMNPTGKIFSFLLIG